MAESRQKSLQCQSRVKHIRSGCLCRPNWQGSNDKGANEAWRKADKKAAVPKQDKVYQERVFMLAELAEQQ